MGTTLPQKWFKPDDLKSGLFTLIQLTSFKPINSEDHFVLYVLKSDDGYLSESFEWGDPKWRPV